MLFYKNLNNGQMIFLKILSKIGKDKKDLINKIDNERKFYFIFFYKFSKYINKYL